MSMTMRRLILPILLSPLLVLFIVGLAITAAGSIIAIAFGGLYCCACGPDSKASILVASMQECLKEDE